MMHILSFNRERGAHMEGHRLWELTPRIRQYRYWHRKERFDLYEDRYPGWMLFAVEDGAFRYEVQDRRGTASFGDLVFCPPHIPFRRETISPLSFHFIMFDWHDPNGNLLEALGHDGPIPIGKITVADRQRLASDYERLKITAGQPHSLRHPWTDHLLKDIWYLYCSESNQAIYAEAIVKDPLMVRAADLLKRHAYGPFSIKSLADTLGLSPVQFTRRFKRAHNMPPTDYLTRLRLQKACSLLVTTAMTLDQIAERCGYENGFYLSRVFSKKIEMSPTQYRRTHRV